MDSQISLIAKLELFAGGPIQATKMLAVDYTGGWAKWKSGKKEMPRYIKESIKAHLALFETKNLPIKRIF